MMASRDRDIELQKCAAKIIKITKQYNRLRPALNYVSILYSNMLYVNGQIGQEMEAALNEIRKAGE